MAYRLLEHLNIGLTWIYATGQRYSLPPGQFFFDPVGTGGNGQVQFNYTGLNTAQFDDYHKLDLNFNYSFKMFNSDFEANKKKKHIMKAHTKETQATITA